MASQNHYSTRYYHRPTYDTNWRSFNNNTWNQGNKIIQQLATKDYDRKELSLDGWIITNGKKKAGT
jgi:hypothetical protein